tara:strand:+ start:613 stop:1716 length:1104 start_codon:yes stop_codon:yes gene_type:complete
MSAKHWFSPSYQEARKRFLDSIEELREKGFEISQDELPLNLKGPQDEDLIIDIAVVGSLECENLLLYSSGIHGVEGFAGSAIQLSILEELKYDEPFKNYCIVFIHIINPYGMAWHRRVNENNVDLNRNFLTSHEGEPVGYKNIDSFINPSSTPRKFDPIFLINGIWLLLKYGFTNIKQWFAQGQYSRPESLQYGGNKIQKSTKLILEWLRTNLEKTKQVFGVDLHTGLGPSGYDTILVPDDIIEDDYKILQSLFGEHVSPLDPTKGVGYRITGDIHSGLAKEFFSINWLCITQEFGTFGPAQVFKNLRAENRWTQNNSLEDQRSIMEHWSRYNLLKTFNPDDIKWKESVISRGINVFRVLQAYIGKI